MTTLPQNVLTQPEIPFRALPGAGTMPTSTPTTAPVNSSYYHGVVPESGCVSVQVGASCIVEIYVWMPATKTWVHPGSASASYQKTFTEACFDYFVAPPGLRFYLKSDTADIATYVGASLT